MQAFCLQFMFLLAFLPVYTIKVINLLLSLSTLCEW